MFRDRVLNPIDPIPRGYADSLKRIENEPDYSLTCLGIALLKNRIDGYSGISGNYYHYDDKTDAVRYFADKVKGIEEYPLYCYFTYNGNSKDSDNVIKELLPEFKQRKNITDFIKAKADCECTVLYHETMNAVGIFVNSRDFRLYHLLMSFMSLYYPSLFKDKEMSEEDYDLVKSLSNKEKDKFFECIKKSVSPYVIEFRRGQLCNLMKKIHIVKIDAARRDVDTQRSEVNNRERAYCDAIEYLKQLIVQYEGLKATENYDEPEQELVEYLATNKDIHDLDIEDSTLKFTVTTLLNNYNEQAWKVFSERGYIYDGQYRTELLNTFKDKNNRKIILDNIFSEDPNLYVKMAGNYRINLDRCRVETRSDYRYTEHNPIFKSYIPNPHLQLFACLGGYKDKVMLALRDRNYIAAIEICVASAGSVNLDETEQTFRPFIGWILSSKEKILRTKDGTEMTPEEALVWLIDKEKKDATD